MFLSPYFVSLIRTLDDGSPSLELLSNQFLQPFQALVKKRLTEEGSLPAFFAGVYLRLHERKLLKRKEASEAKGV